jgi:hypothetical protein
MGAASRTSVHPIGPEVSLPVVDSERIRDIVRAGPADRKRIVPNPLNKRQRGARGSVNPGAPGLAMRLRPSCSCGRAVIKQNGPTIAKLCLTLPHECQPVLSRAISSDCERPAGSVEAVVV